MYVCCGKNWNWGRERDSKTHHTLVDMSSSCLQFIVTHYYIIYITHVTHEPSTDYSHPLPIRRGLFSTFLSFYRYRSPCISIIVGFVVVVVATRSYSCCSHTHTDNSRWFIIPFEYDFSFLVFLILIFHHCSIIIWRSKICGSEWHQQLAMAISEKNVIPKIVPSHPHRI